ncbi:MAG: Fic family protein [Actinomycetota bacterium]
MPAGSHLPLWPSVGSERLTWLVAEGGDSRRSNRGRPYDSAVVPEIADAELLLPSECALISEDVRTAIASFDLRVGEVLAPLEALLVRIESAASSRIENVAAPVPELFVESIDADGGRSATEVIGNVDATTSAIVLAEDITPATILDVHRSLLRSTNPVIAGRWRDEVVWIGSYAAGPPGAHFVPPAVRRIEPAMQDLCDFMGRTDIPVFVQAMIAHAQFETIHPFPDGNGRVGRALVHAMLRRDGLTKSATLPISAGIVSQKHRYFQALTEYRDGDFVPIVELGADATFAALRNATHLFHDVQELEREWRERASGIRADSAIHKMIGVLLARPVLAIDDVAELTATSHATARSTIRTLSDLDVLRPVAVADDGKPRWMAHEVIDAVNGFTDRSINPFGRH